MRSFILLVALVCACDRATGPDHGPDNIPCIRKGDTLGILIAYKDNVADTTWIIAQRDTGCD